MSSDNTPKFDLKKAEKAFKELYNKGKYSPKDLDQYQDLINETYKVLNYELEDNDVPEELKERLQNDTFIFSGLKTHAQLTEASKLLVNDDGTIKPFYQYSQDIKKLNATYNQNYLEAEYQFALSSSEMAVKWQEIEKNKGRYDLQYRTANDDRVRDSHAALQDITLPVDDPFWSSYYPPNGWRCRCVAIEVLKGKYTTSDSESANKKGEEATTKITKSGKNALEIFRFNPGMKKVVFPPKHPYRKVAGSTSALNILDSIIKERVRRKKIFEKLKKDTNYKDVSFNPDNGGLKATHVGHQFHKNTGMYEKEARDVMFENGNKIILGDETPRKGKKGNFVDGDLNQYKYEQATITGTGKNAIKRALNHARTKAAQAAVLYFPKKELYSAKRLEEGIAKYNGQTQYRFKKIVVIVEGKIIRQ